MAQAPFLSIVTISFNQREFLQECVDSVLSQKADDVEYIVVDPGSTDGSRELLESCRGRIDHLVLEKDKGPADGLNNGFARATGRIGYFINSDDFLLPGAIDRMRAIWDRHPEADAVAGAAWMIDGKGEPMREVLPTRVTVDGLMTGETLVVQHGLSFRMDRFREVGGFNATNRTIWDYELMCDFAARGWRFQRTWERYGVFRLHDLSLSGGGHGAAHDARYWADVNRIYDKFKPDASLVDRARRRLGKGLKYLMNPDWAVRHAAAHASQAGLRARWRRDMGLPESDAA